ncbi:MAG: type II secretion system inner membrane protein GspF [Thermodesulfovibrionales bacterium]
MPIFRYRAYRAGGSEAAGTIEADGPRDARAKVRELGFYPRRIERVSEGKGRRFSLRRDDRGRLPEITRQLSVLIRSGVPLVEALRALSEENRGYWKGILIGVRERVVSGASLSRAMEDYGRVFPEFYRNMVHSGEASGTLDMVLVRLADFLEHQGNVREKVKGAMVYPVFMASVGIVVLSFIFTFVVPKIVKIFEDTEEALPLMTTALIFVSNVFVHYWWALILAAVAALYGGRKLARKHRAAVDRALLGLPFHGLYYSRFTRTLGFLLDGGLPMLRALELAGKSTGNAYLERKVREAEARVSEGARLSAALEGLPPVLLQLIATGEKSGKLAEVLNRAADAYDSEFDRKVQRALSLLEPSMILVMGLIVGFIVLAVLLPMFQLNQLIK